MSEEIRSTKPLTITPEQQSALLKGFNADKIVSECEGKLTDAIFDSAANDRASKEPLPGAIKHAFELDGDVCIVNTSVGKVRIRSAKFGDVKIFALIDSPFYQLMKGDIKEEENDAESNFKLIFPNEDIISSVIFQFTHSIEEVFKVAKNGPEIYNETAMLEVGCKYSTADTLLLLEAIMKHMGIVKDATVEFQAVQQEMDSDTIGTNKKKLM